MQVEMFEAVKEKEFSQELLQFFAENNLQSVLSALKNSKGSNNFFALSVEDKTKISYLRGDRIPENRGMLYDSEYRKKYAYHTRIGKIISGMEYDADEYRRVCELLFLRGKKYNIQFTKNIRASYHEENYADSSGDLGNSCMRHDSSQDAIGFYNSLGADVVSLAVIRDCGGAILARGLFWKAVRIKTDDVSRYDNQAFKYTEYLDRVYAVDSNVASALYQWAESKNIPHYKNNSFEKLVKIPYSAQDTDAPMPYFDTFRYCDEALKGLSSFGGDVCLDSTEYDSVDELTSGRYSCADCGARMHEDDSNYVDDVGSCCDECAVYSEAYENCIMRGDAVYSENLNSWINKGDDNYIYCEGAEDYFHCDDCTYDDYAEEYIPSCDAVQLENGDYTHQDNAVDYEGENYLIDECTQNENGTWIPEGIEDESIV
ncbi:MAG: hypothetical protein JRJ45_00090 [Deltaproteobacteria bacterium]|nr:hypothetical protein [Deltaproteobacteria bacterium]